MTFSIAARCATTGRFAVAVASSSPAVAARCAYARAGVGAATTQNITDPRLGPKALDLMALGADAAAARAVLVAVTPHIDHRQLTMIDAQGRTAVFSGSGTLGTHGEAEGQDVVSAGNLLANPDVPQAIVAAFEASAGQDLGDRIIAAMAAGLAAGGEAGPIFSAGMQMVGEVSWPIADLRVDWHETPIAELGRLWNIYKPQMEAYVTRALNPVAAPSYGVPGDE
ncbi:DUF1028 domain-containing protein [Acidisoma cellulosilytica]|uniref:DUF1028 domain-containing protein n=1 Tax=Acidisoma cellulosilyticum TaxID=2802395 RepID=A0A963Z1G0_9PROT|nr:DUF1028 domain-containing protein [Acidisoma cellulosilyticum]MCB8880242.1 DUF1028 domain-containing protein [Acidisoma cellulosilyticum]